MSIELPNLTYAYEALGMVVHRILRKIAGNDASDFGDTSKLDDPTVIGGLINGRLSDAATTKQSERTL